MPLEPRYISTVDSGNLAGHLLTVAAACREIVSEPAVRPIAFKGVADAVGLVDEAALELGPVDRSQTVLRHDLELALEALAEEPECRTVLLSHSVLAENPCATIKTIRDSIDSQGTVVLMVDSCEESTLSSECIGLFEECIDLPVIPAQLKRVLEKHLGDDNPGHAE